MFSVFVLYLCCYYCLKIKKLITKKKPGTSDVSPNLKSLTGDLKWRASGQIPLLGEHNCCHYLTENLAFVLIIRQCFKSSEL